MKTTRQPLRRIERIATHASRCRWGEGRSVRVATNGGTSSAKFYFNCYIFGCYLAHVVVILTVVVTLTVPLILMN